MFLKKDSQSDVVTKRIFKDVKKVISDFKVVNFFICIIFFGIFYASTSLYLLWYVYTRFSSFSCVLSNDSNRVVGTSKNWSLSITRKNIPR